MSRHISATELQGALDQAAALRDDYERSQLDARNLQLALSQTGAELADAHMRIDKMRAEASASRALRHDEEKQRAYAEARAVTAMDMAKLVITTTLGAKS
jgi:hypothetical protein